MKNILSHVRTYIVRGFWAIIPIALSLFAIQLVYVSIDQRVTGLIDRLLGFSLPGLGILLLLLTLYLLGLIASNVMGRKFFGAVEHFTQRIPLIKTTYRIGKQLSTTLSLPERQVFKRAVLVEYLRPGMWTIGLVTP